MLAERDEQGRVRFEADLRILRPGTGNGRLLFVVANRGLLGGVPFSGPAAGLGFPPTEQLDPGDGFLLDAGWTIAWCGWQWDVLCGPGIVGLAAPTVAIEPGWLRVEFRPDADQPDHPLSDSSRCSPSPTTRRPSPTTPKRCSTNGPLRTLSLSRSHAPGWHFSDDSTVALDGGFQAFHWYTLVYRSRFCPVTGTSLLAVRDAVSYLRREGQFEAAFGYGVSQSGRLLRQFLYEARNLDEEGDVVFDGVFAHIAGGRAVSSTIASRSRP